MINKYATGIILQSQSVIIRFINQSYHQKKEYKK